MEVTTVSCGPSSVDRGGRPWERHLTGLWEVSVLQKVREQTQQPVRRVVGRAPVREGGMSALNNLSVPAVLGV